MVSLIHSSLILSFLTQRFRSSLSDPTHQNQRRSTRGHQPENRVCGINTRFPFLLPSMSPFALCQIANRCPRTPHPAPPFALRQIAVAQASPLTIRSAART
uniref:Secreted protein n=1 Tax=Oryza glumipatula TaxID=40148 RepID=A0A0D9Z889_9ORYZ